MKPGISDAVCSFLFLTQLCRKIKKWSDVWPSMTSHTLSLCSAFNPSKCTHSSENTHGAVSSHFCCSTRGAVGVRYLAQGHLGHGYWVWKRALYNHMLFCFSLFFYSFCFPPSCLWYQNKCPNHPQNLLVKCFHPPYVRTSIIVTYNCWTLLIAIVLCKYCKTVILICSRVSLQMYTFHVVKIKTS